MSVSVKQKVLKNYFIFFPPPLSPFSPSVPTTQLLLVLLLAMPEALSAEAAVDLPVLSALLSLPFYLLCLLLASVHVLVCTSAESSCYFCSLSWGLVFAAIAFSSAMFCIMVSMATRRLPLGPKIHGKVSPSASKYTKQKQVPMVTDVCSHRCIHMCFVNRFSCCLFALCQRILKGQVRKKYLMFVIAESLGGNLTCCHFKDFPPCIVILYIIK